MADMHEGELEMELEDEFHEGEGEEESGLEGEGWLGAIGNIASSLLGEGEEELEDESSFESELEDESSFESEDEIEGELEDESGLEGEGWLGALGNIAGSLLGEGEDEIEGESSFESEDEGEQFFGKIGRFFKKNAGLFKKIAKVAAPLVGTAIGGPFGSALGGLAAKALGEGEYESEEEFEGEGEMTHEIASHELTHNEAAAEMMADAASREQHEGEAEAMAGAATMTVISPKDRRALRRILPYMIRGTAILTRILRRRRSTRPAVRAVPTIMRRAVKDLKRQAAKGIPITRKHAARATAKQVRRVLGSPHACTAAVARNVKVSRAYKRPHRRFRGRSQRRRRAIR